jgi:FtsZ-interacting cell division protein ZipA
LAPNFSALQNRKPQGMYSNIKCKYKSDFEKHVVLNNIEKRGFVRTDDDDWHFYWASVGSAKMLFNPENGFRFADYQ